MDVANPAFLRLYYQGSPAHQKLQNLYTLFTTQHCTCDITKDTVHYAFIKKSKFDILKLCIIYTERIEKCVDPKKEVTIFETYLSCCTGKVKLPSLLASVKHSLSCMSCSSIDVNQIIKFCG